MPRRTEKVYEYCTSSEFVRDSGYGYPNYIAGMIMDKLRTKFKTGRI